MMLIFTLTNHKIVLEFILEYTDLSYTVIFFLFFFKFKRFGVYSLEFVYLHSVGTMMLSRVFNSITHMSSVALWIARSSFGIFILDRFLNLFFLFSTFNAKFYCFYSSLVGCSSYILLLSYLLLYFHQYLKKKKFF